jgi:hypothetical protein
VPFPRRRNPQGRDDQLSRIIITVRKCAAMPLDVRDPAALPGPDHRIERINALHLIGFDAWIERTSMSDSHKEFD